MWLPSSTLRLRVPPTPDLVVVTLGPFLPWAMLRNFRYQCEKLELVGHTGIDEVHQRVIATSPASEAAASLLDIDIEAGGGFGI